MKINQNLTFTTMATLVALTATLLFPTSPAAAGNSAPVRLTFVKTFAGGGPAPYLFHFTGSFGGDFTGTLYTGVLVRQDIDEQQQIINLEAVYVFTAANGTSSFTAHVEGNENLHTGKAVLNGVVTAGALAGAQVQVQFDVLGGGSFGGTVRIMTGSAN